MSDKWIDSVSKPCPFCGACEILLYYREDGYQERCDDCEARGPLMRTRQESSVAWNTRAEVIVLPEEICEGCGYASDDLKADAGDNVLCKECRELP